MVRASNRFRRLAAQTMSALVATAASATALSGQAVADHETVGGGTYGVANSDGPCTDFENGGLSYTACVGSWVYLPSGGDYITVPLNNHAWVSCVTYAPNGQVYETDVENLSEVPRKQRFWDEKGWGLYRPTAMCQLW